MRENGVGCRRPDDFPKARRAPCPSSWGRNPAILAWVTLGDGPSSHRLVACDRGWSRDRRSQYRVQARFPWTGWVRLRSPTVNEMYHNKKSPFCQGRKTKKLLQLDIFPLFSCHDLHLLGEHFDVKLGSRNLFPVHRELHGRNAFYKDMRKRNGGGFVGFLY